MRHYQFHLNRRPVGLLRLLWDDAANDAVQAGQAIWVTEHRVSFHRGAAVKEVQIGEWVGESDR